ncbi:MAG: PIN domain-containing protein [Candidatus Dadabacteria bacterium]|nr:MAG: PIN domain-containing protein [Candidatus Dadabacteria bacterium]
MVIDASVVVKWVFPTREGEEDVGAALDLLRDIRSGAVTVVQPPHWLAEAGAVIARLAPDIAPRALELLWAMELPVLDTLDLYRLAAELSGRLAHHLFDTLYHAAALLTPGAVCYTADRKYLGKARPLGAIEPVSSYVPRSGNRR